MDTKSARTARLLLNAGRSDAHASAWVIDRPLTIGRAEADIVLAINTLSRQHARVAPDGGGYVLTDLNSRNGTAINGRFLKGERADLSDGDIIVLGGAAQFGFHDPMATPLVPRVGKLDGLWLNPDNNDVWFDACLIDPPLTTRQYALLQLLYDAQGSLVGRAEIVKHVWSDRSADGISDDAVDSLIKRLRRRLSGLDYDGQAIEVVRGAGVRLCL